MAGFAGLATSYFAAMAMTIRESPVVAVAELVIRLTPGPVAERAIRFLGHLDKPVLLVVILIVLGARVRVGRPTGPTRVVAARHRVRRGRRRRRRRGVGAAGAAGLNYLPLAVGFATWLICLSLLTEPLRRAELDEGAAG